MKLYSELADWWHLLSAPEEYEEEATLYRHIIERYRKDIQHVLELGSGGGNNAFHLKKHFQMTLVDVAPAMIKESKRLNPECEHHVGDMRSVQLQRTFDLVFIHDAIMYMTTEGDLEKVFQVAYSHLNRNGLLFIAPDFFKETFKPSTSHGGHDGKDKSIRYLEWTEDRNPDDHQVETVFCYLLKNGNDPVRVEYDTAIEGLFSKKTWETLLKKSGFEVNFELIEHSDVELHSYMAIVAKRI